MLVLIAANGCALAPPSIDQQLLREGGSSERNRHVAERYLVHCPDVLAIEVPQCSEVSGRREVGTDGRIDLGPWGRLRVEGKTVSEIRLLIAAVVNESATNVRVEVVEYRSQHVYLFGEVVGKQRAAPYRGQETVLDLLQRVGGITPGAAPESVYIVRPRVTEGKQPEIIHVQLRDIVTHHDQTTNVRLQPFDEIHIGETRESYLKKCLPPCLSILYGKVCNLRRQVKQREELALGQAASGVGWATIGRRVPRFGTVAHGDEPTAVVGPLPRFRGTRPD